MSNLVAVLRFMRENLPSRRNSIKVIVVIVTAMTVYAIALSGIDLDSTTDWGLESKLTPESSHIEVELAPISGVEPQIQFWAVSEKCPEKNYSRLLHGETTSSLFEVDPQCNWTVGTTGNVPTRISEENPSGYVAHSRKIVAFCISVIVTLLLGIFLLLEGEVHRQRVIRRLR